MKASLQAGIKTTWSYCVPPTKTVPQLYPEAPEFAAMPGVFATGFMVGLLEWTCMKVVADHLDPGEGSLGIHIDVSHVAATLPGQTIQVEAECIKVEGRRISFAVTAHDGVEVIGKGTHQRMIVPWDKFASKVNAKAAIAGVAGLSGFPA